MPKFLAGIVVTIALLAVAVQLALPAYLEGRAEKRLEDGGGSANVSIGAFPALTLIAGSGKDFEATGSDLAIDLEDRREDPFGRLDGFENVDVDLTQVDAGSITMTRFELTREGRDSEYEMTVRATATPQELARELGRATGGPLGGLVGALAGGAFPGGGTTEIPLELDARIRSEDGQPDVRDTSGSVAGLPAGPLAGVVLGAVLEQL